MVKWKKITLVQGWAFIIGNLNSLWEGFIFFTCSNVGVPKILIISTSWSIADSPGNKGSKITISAKTHAIFPKKKYYYYF